MHNKIKELDSVYDPKEERLNVQTHVVDVLLASVGFVLLLLKGFHIDSKALVVYGTYGCSQILLFSASSFYHASREVKIRRHLRMLDHAAIYIAIAGTYTPFCIYGMSKAEGYTLLIIVWVLAIGGITFKIFFTGKYKLVSTIFYIMMAGVGLLYADNFLAHVNAYALVLLLSGGLVFLVGAILYSFKRIAYNHALFHVCVVVASILHFSAIYFYVSP